MARQKYPKIRTRSGMVLIMDPFNKAIIIAALGEYATAHPDLVAQIDQAEAELLEF